MGDPNYDAEQLIQEQRHGDAINLLTDFLNREGPTAQTLINRATAFIGVNEQEKAVQDLQDASQRNPSPEEEQKIEQLIESLSKHVVNNLDSTSSRALGDSQDRDLQSTLINGLVGGGLGGGSSSQFSKLKLLAGILGSGSSSGSGSSQFSLGQVASLLSGQSSSGQSSGGQSSGGSGLGSLLSSFTGGSKYGNNNNQSYGGHSNSGSGLSSLLNQFTGGNSNHNIQAGHNQGGYGQQGYNQGGYSQQGYNQGGYSQQGYNQGHSNSSQGFGGDGYGGKY